MAPQARKFVRGRLIPVLALAAAVVAALGWAVASRAAQARLLATPPDRLAADPDLNAAAVRAGRRIFAARCAGCHGERGEGGDGAPNLTDGDQLYGTGQVGELEQTIAYGVRAHDPRGWDLADMPAFGRETSGSAVKVTPLSPGDIRDVVAFLAAQRGETADPAAAARGREIYSNRGGCYDCHGGDARGDPAIGAPNLIDHVWLYGDGSPQRVFEIIADGRRGVMPAFAGRLSAVQLRQVAVFTHSLAGRPKS